MQNLFVWATSLRHVATLQKQLVNVDLEYDKCNLVFMNGEVNGFTGKLPVCTSQVASRSSIYFLIYIYIFIYLYIYIYIYTHANIDVYRYIYIGRYVDRWRFAYKYICMHICIYAYI